MFNLLAACPAGLASSPWPALHTCAHRTARARHGTRTQDEDQLLLCQQDRPFGAVTTCLRNLGLSTSPPLHLAANRPLVTYRKSKQLNANESRLIIPGNAMFLQSRRTEDTVARAQIQSLRICTKTRYRVMAVQIIYINAFLAGKNMSHTQKRVLILR